MPNSKKPRKEGSLGGITLIFRSVLKMATSNFFDERNSLLNVLVYWMKSYARFQLVATVNINRMIKISTLSSVSQSCFYTLLSRSPKKWVYSRNSWFYLESMLIFSQRAWKWIHLAWKIKDHSKSFQLVWPLDFPFRLIKPIITRESKELSSLVFIIRR